MNTNYSLPDHSRLHAANNPYVEINEPFSSFQNFSPDGRQMSTYQHHGAPTTVHPISRNWILSTSNPQNWQTPAQNGYLSAYSHSAIGPNNPAKINQLNHYTRSWPQVPSSWNHLSGNDINERLYSFHNPVTDTNAPLHEISRYPFEIAVPHFAGPSKYSDDGRANFPHPGIASGSLSIDHVSNGFIQNDHRGLPFQNEMANVNGFSIYPKRLRTTEHLEARSVPFVELPTFERTSATTEREKPQNAQIRNTLTSDFKRQHVPALPVSNSSSDNSQVPSANQHLKHITETHWKKVLEWGSLTNPSPFTSMNSIQWSEVFKFLEIETDKTGQEIMDEFFSHAIPNLAKLDPGCSYAKLCLEVCDTRACMIIYHSLSSGSIIEIREKIGQLIQSQVLSTEINSLSDWTKLFILKTLSIDTVGRPLNADQKTFVEMKEHIVTDLTERLNLSEFDPPKINSDNLSSK